MAIVHPQDQIDYDDANSSYLKTAQTFSALIDTGATSTMISPHVVERMQLIPIGKMEFYNISGQEWHNSYLFHVGFAGATVHLASLDLPVPVPPGKWSTVHVYKRVIKGGELPSNRPFNVLLGMDVISSGRLEVDKSGHFSFTF